MLVIGARPQIIKSAPIVHEASKHAEMEFQLVHTGQHYDFEMIRVFFGELELPNPFGNGNASAEIIEALKVFP